MRLGVGFLYLDIMVSEISTLLFRKSQLIVQYDDGIACFNCRFRIPILIPTQGLFTPSVSVNAATTL